MSLSWLFVVWALGALAYAAWRVDARCLEWAAKHFMDAFVLLGWSQGRARVAGKLTAFALLLVFAVAWPASWPVGLLYRFPIDEDA